MFAGLPRWLLLGLVLTACVMLLVLFRPASLELPEDCRKAESAMDEQEYNRAIEHFFLCLEGAVIFLLDHLRNSPPD